MSTLASFRPATPREWSLRQGSRWRRRGARLRRRRRARPGPTRVASMYPLFAGSGRFETVRDATKASISAGGGLCGTLQVPVAERSWRFESSLPQRAEILEDPGAFRFRLPGLRAGVAIHEALGGGQLRLELRRSRDEARALVPDPHAPYDSHIDPPRHDHRCGRAPSRAGRRARQGGIERRAPRPVGGRAGAAQAVWRGEGSGARRSAACRAHARPRRAGGSGHRLLCSTIATRSCEASDDRRPRRRPTHLPRWRRAVGSPAQCSDHLTGAKREDQGAEDPRADR